MNKEEYDRIYNKTLNEVKDMLRETTHSTKYIDTRSMSKKEKE